MCSAARVSAVIGRRTVGAGAKVRGGFTLLELILALSLSVLVLMAIGMAVHLNMRTLDSRRDRMEESQLARSLLRMLANDIRSIALRYEQDVSSVKEMLAGAAADQILGGEVGGEDGGGSESGGGLDEGGGAAGGDSGTSGQTPGGDAGDADSGADSGDQGDPSANTENLSSTAVVALTPGVYGSATELQLDISRVPRSDQYQPMYDDTGAMSGIRDIPADTKTVTYYVQAADSTVALSADDVALAQLTDPTVQSGLVRRELDRAATSWQMTNNSAALLQSGEVVAPEVVAIQFQYFDGTEWRTEWDTETEQALPLAIEITLGLRTGEANAADGLPATDMTELGQQAGIRVYRLVVELPVEMPPSSQGGETDSGAADLGTAGELDGTGL